MYWGGRCRNFNLSLTPLSSFGMSSSRHTTGSVSHTVTSMPPGCSQCLHLRSTSKCLFLFQLFTWTTCTFELLLSVLYSGGLDELPLPTQWPFLLILLPATWEFYCHCFSSVPGSLDSSSQCSPWVPPSSFLSPPTPQHP